MSRDRQRWYAIESINIGHLVILKVVKSIDNPISNLKGVCYKSESLYANLNKTSLVLSS